MFTDPLHKIELHDCFTHFTSTDLMANIDEQRLLSISPKLPNLKSISESRSVRTYIEVKETEREKLNRIHPTFLPACPMEVFRFFIPRKKLEI